LAAHLAQPFHYWPCTSLTATFAHSSFVPAYSVSPQADARHRIHRLADAVAILAERLHRLQQALPYWRHLDAGVYFDFRPIQTQAIVHIERLGAALDVTLYADLLSPAFRLAEHYWATSYCPAYYAADQSRNDAFTQHFRQQAQPTMQAHLQTARHEIAAAGELLFQRGDISFLTAAAAPDEQQRHAAHLLRPENKLFLFSRHLPTLTLSRSFDLLEAGKSTR